jgi:hypothetical protein
VTKPELSSAEAHFDSVLAGFMRGRLTPVLGAGVNLCARTADDSRAWLGRFPPSGTELAFHLAVEFKYPPTEPIDLLRVSQYIYAIRGGSGPLYDALRDVFDKPFRPTPVHDFIASVPAAVRNAPRPGRPPVIVTTNYDDLVEVALQERGEEYDVIVYVAEGVNEGRFCYRPPEGRLQPIAEPRSNLDFDPDQRTIVLKIHGFVDRLNSANDNDDSYVITEDHYIDYLAHANLSKLIPASLMARMRTSHFLFLGYGMRDWNLRVILHHVWSQQVRRFGSWAIRNDRDEIEERFWQRHRVEIVRVPLEDWVAAMHAAGQ